MEVPLLFITFTLSCLVGLQFVLCPSKGDLIIAHQLFLHTYVHTICTYVRTYVCMLYAVLSSSNTKSCVDVLYWLYSLYWIYVCIIVVFIIRMYIYLDYHMLHTVCTHFTYILRLFQYVCTAYILECCVHTNVVTYVFVYWYVRTSVGSARGGLSRSCPQASPVGPESKEEQNCKFALSTCAQIMTEAQFRVLWSSHLVVPFNLCSPQMMTERYSTSLPTTAY